MPLLDSLRWRYATKKFDAQRVVPENDVEKILEAGNLAPTSYGLQPYRFIVINNQSLQEQLVPLSFNQNQVADASHVIVIAVRTDLDDDYIQAYLTRMESTRELPTGSLDGFGRVMRGTVASLSEDAMYDWNARQAYIALGTMMAEAAELGVDSCPMEGFQPDHYDELLGLPEKNLRSVLVLPIGYRADDDQAQHQPKVRWPLSDLVIRI
jgi:nitroreductase/dihydropteridine reductase